MTSGGTIGLPVPSTDISIRDDDAARWSMGEPGEICIRGPQVMAVIGTALMRLEGHALPMGLQVGRHRSSWTSGATSRLSIARRT